MTTFTFIAPGPLHDAELELRVLENRPAVPEKQYVPSTLIGMFIEDKLVGSVNLRLQDLPSLQRFAGHVGYEVNEAHRGHHYAERACRLLWPLMRAYGFTEVVLLPANPITSHPAAP